MVVGDQRPGDRGAGLVVVPDGGGHGQDALGDPDGGAFEGPAADAQTVTCPHGATSASWTPCSQAGKKAIVATFSADDCAPCPARPLCTTSKTRRRQLTLLPRDLHDAQAQARSAENDRSWQAGYARRAGVEGTMQQAVATCGSRRARYRGLAKTAWNTPSPQPP